MNKYILSLGILMLGIASTLKAQTVFRGPANGDWSTETNWSAGVPAFGNDATIPNGASVRITEALTIDFMVLSFGSITNTATLIVNTSLTSGGSFRNEATMTIGATATFVNGGGFTNTGMLTNNGTITGSSSFTNTATATVVNANIWNQFAPLSNDGILTNQKTFSSPSTFTNNKTVTNAAMADFKVDFGGIFSNATGSSFSNAGTAQNVATFENRSTVTNTGTFTNNGLLTNSGSFDNSGTASFENTATVNDSGSFTNESGATITSGFRFNVLSGGLAINFGRFNNNDGINVSAGGLFSNEMGATIATGFGSSITNAGLFKNKTTASIAGNGSVLNDNVFENAGLLDAQNGSQINNTDTLTNSGILRMVNVTTNNRYILNTGTIENNGGGVWTNTGKIENAAGATLTNGFDIFNRPMGQILNNGRLINLVRLTNEANLTNNAYLRTEGDILNKQTGTLTNTELTDIIGGALVNEGSVANNKIIVNNSCSIISNKMGATIQNSGNLRNLGVIFQRGSMTGNPVQTIDGLIQIGANTSAPSVCKPLVRAGTDLMGNAKVDAPAVISKGFGVDSCQGVQYLIDGLTRRTYTCTNVGTIVSNVPVSIRFRTNDELTCTTNIEVFDNVAPQIANCPTNVQLVTDLPTAVFTWATITATDNCGATPTFTTTHPSGTAFPLGLTEVVVQATDNFTNIAECRFKVQVQQGLSNGACTPMDNTVPVFANCPPNISINTALSGSTAFWVAPSVSDNCLPIQVRSTANPAQFFLSGTTTIRYTATDANGNVSTCSFDVVINGNTNPCTTDLIKPVISNCPSNFSTAFNPAINGAIAVWTAPSVSDNCSTPTLTATAISGSIFPMGTTGVVYTATDARNNEMTCQFLITVATSNPCATDATPPVISGCPANQNVMTSTENSIATWTEPRATDDCSTVSSNRSHDIGSLFGLGETTVVYQFSDLAGNKAVCFFKITVQNTCLVDVVRPTITCPANITAPGTSSMVSVAWANPTVADDCTTPSVSSNFASGSAFPVGITTVIYTAIDGNGNTATCSFMVTVSNPCTPDNTPPVFTNCPQNLTVNSQTVPAVATWTAPTATDFCSMTTVSTNHNSGENFPAGTTSVIYNAVDNIGNRSTCSFTVTILLDCTNDITSPIFTNCPQNQNLTTTGTTAVATWATPTATDNCSTPTLTSTHNSGFAFPIGARIVSYTATDAKGNMEVCRFTITVTSINPCTNDIDPPTFTDCPANISVTTTGSTAVATWTAPTVKDICSVPTVSLNFQSGHSFSVGSTSVIYIATDAAGNKATCRFTVTVNQQTVGSYCASKGTEPWQEWITRVQFNTLNNVSDKILNGTDIGYSNFTNLTTTVNRSSSYALSITAGLSWSGRGAALYSRAWIDFNADGDFTDAGEMVLSAQNPQAFAAMVLIPMTAAMGNTRLRVAVKSGGFPTPCETFALGEVEDYTITIGGITNGCNTDTQAPTLSACPANISLTTTSTTAIAIWAAPTATDNCSIPSVSSNFTSGQSFPLGLSTVIYTATDAAGNRATCSFIVTVSQQTTGGTNDIGLTISSNLTAYQKFTPISFTISAKNNGGQAMTNIKIEFRFPTKTVTSGGATPSIGIWREWCTGGIQCFEWSIPSLAANALTTLTVPLFILDATAPIVATTRLLASTPTDGFAANNTTSVTINPIINPSPLSKKATPQYLPLIIQQISPNPTDGELRVDLNSLIAKEVQFDISDMAGKIIRSANYPIEKGANRLNLDVTVLPAGVYFIIPSTQLAKGQPMKFVKI